jgi:hypothetical protein
MIIGRSSTNFMFFMPIGNPRWLPPQVIVLTQDHMGKIQKYIRLIYSGRYCCANVNLGARYLQVQVKCG